MQTIARFLSLSHSLISWDTDLCMHCHFRCSQPVSQSVSHPAISMCDLNVERDIDIRWTTARIVLTFQFRCALKRHGARCTVHAHCTCICILIYGAVCESGAVNCITVRQKHINCMDRTCIRLQPELGQTDRSKPLANEMTFAHCFRCLHRVQRTSFYVVFFILLSVFIIIIVLVVAVVIFYSIGIISWIRLSHFMGIEHFFYFNRSLPLRLSNENVNANSNKSDANIISLTFLGMCSFGILVHPIANHFKCRI